MAKLTADYFTDPLCPASWCNEPLRRRLVEEFGDQIEWRQRMGGFYDRWEDVDDKAAGLKGGEPAGFVAQWQALAREHRAPLEPAIWAQSPLRSTTPASLAVKAAELQSPRLAASLLRRIREAAMTEARPLDTRKALLELAKEVPGLDLYRFANEFDDEPAYQAFLKDVEDARHPLAEAKDAKPTHDGRKRYAFPTLVLRNATGDRRVVSGGAPFEAYLRAITDLARDLHRRRPPEAARFVRKYRRVFAREVEEVCHLSATEARAALGQLRDEGWLWARPVAGGEPMWELQRWQ